MHFCLSNAFDLQWGYQDTTPLATPVSKCFNPKAMFFPPHSTVLFDAKMKMEGLILAADG